MINCVPLIGWIISFLLNASMAFPFWICWTLGGIGETYFDFLPVPWQSISFWNCVGLFVSASIIKTVFVPKLVNPASSSAKTQLDVIRDATGELKNAVSELKNDEDDNGTKVTLKSTIGSE